MTALCPQDQGFAAALPRLALLANDQQNYRDDRQQKDVASAVHVGEESIELGHVTLLWVIYLLLNRGAAVISSARNRGFNAAIKPRGF
jgi:hypothetical protein